MNNAFNQVLEALNSYLTSLGLNALLSNEFEQVLEDAKNGYKVDAIKKLREFSTYYTVPIIQEPANKHNEFYQYVLAAYGELTKEKRTLGLKQAKEMIDVLELCDNRTERKESA
jgi:ribosomal protein L7/L12